MLGSDFEKMVVISNSNSTTNHQWTQVQNTIDEKGLMASTGRGMEKPIASRDHQHQQQPPPQQQQLPPPHLKCPRCDSSNTKFCYYNNYSLSQPRHFCKACKRYWTRGGTLRNVPVGGGCRKNKRVRRPSTTTDQTTPLSSASAATTNPIHVQPRHAHVDLSSTSTHMNPMFYGLPTNPSELNLPYPSRLNSSRDHVSGFDLQPRLNVLGLGFSSSGLMGSDINNDPHYSTYHIHGSSTSNSSSTLASLIASSFQQQNKLFSNGNMQGGNNFPFENLNMAAGNVVEGGMKMEGGGQNRFDWNHVNNQNDQTMQQINSSSDPSLWNTNGVGSWLDPSVPSLI